MTNDAGIYGLPNNSNCASSPVKSSSRMRRIADLVWFNAIAELRVDLARTYLGLTWWVIDPVLVVLVFYIVFGLLLQRGGPGFVSFLLCGQIAYRWFSYSVMGGANSVSSGAGMMAQVYLPKIVFPMIVVLQNSIKNLFVFVILLVALLAVGYRPTFAWLALPVIMTVQLLFVSACCGLASAVVPLLPDLRMLLERAMQMMFFLSGIFYDISDPAFPRHLQKWFYINPMALLIKAYRDVLLEGLWPEWLALGWSAVVSLLGIFFVIYLMKRFDYVYPKHVL